MAFRPAKDGSELAPNKAGRTERAAPWRGRPKVADQKARKASIRYTAAEYATVEEAAQQSGLSFGAYVRKVTTGKAGPRARHQKTGHRIEMAKALADWGKVGSNINQLARAANMHRQGVEPQTFQAILRALNELKSIFEKALDSAL